MSSWRIALRALGRQTGVHFVALGGLLFLLRAGLAAPPAPAPARTAVGPDVTAEPGPSDDELLLREALRIGLDREPPVRRRLVANMRFLFAGTAAGDDEFYRQAREIGFQRTDPVARRFMVEQMRLLARSGHEPEVFTEAELEGYLRRHPERYTTPAMVCLTQVFLRPGRRGALVAREARRLLARLRSDSVSPETAPALGDPFPLGHHTGMVAASDLERIYGARFAGAVMGLPVGVWSGPVESSQGLHLVWIHQARQAKLARLAEVRSRVILALTAQRGEARLAEYVRRLRERAEVEVASR